MDRHSLAHQWKYHIKSIIFNGGKTWELTSSDNLADCTCRQTVDDGSDGEYREDKRRSEGTHHDRPIPR